MAKEKNIGLSIKKEDDMPGWYTQVIIMSGFADFAPIKGCMIIRPPAYACWENLQDYFNKLIKSQGVKNAYFPMFIPESFFTREAKHAEGFAPEVAWIERKDETQERLALRPTSETIMYDSYSRWIRSHRDLPLRINQWCNIVRWEVQDCKLFLRSREFLWQEGHCVYATEEERNKETLLYLEDYRKVSEDFLAVPVTLGEKTESERFAGADRTYTIEGFMPDGKALQMGTSHDLSQGFAKAFNIEFTNEKEERVLPYQNSWGISTRLLGAMVMTHSDNKGLVLPPRIASEKIVIVPILFEKTKDEVIKKAEEIKESLKEYNPILDLREEYSPGWKFNDWELKGVPLRIEIGPRDLENNQVVVSRRDNGVKETIKISDLNKLIPKMLEDMHNDLLKKAREDINKNTVECNNWKDFEEHIKNRKRILVPFCCDEEAEKEIKEKTNGATSRCIPFDRKLNSGAKCFYTGKPAKALVYFSKSY